jgi:Family of unknown function (DUF5309)
MKFKVFLAFSLVMCAAALAGALPPTLAYLAIFLVGALLSPRQALAISNVAGYLSRANADTNDDVGEWQTGVLHRNAKGMNTGSTLFALMSRLRSENADSQTYNWFEKDPTRREFYADAAYSSTVTAMQFSNTTAASTYDNGTLDQTICALLKNGAILENTRTGERLIVVSESSTYSVPVLLSRGAPGYSSTPTSAVNTTPAAVNQYDKFVLIGVAKPNGANPSTSAYTQPARQLNYIQTFNATASVENAYVNGILRTDLDGPWYEQKIDALERVANDIELSYFFGVAAINGTTYTTGGIRNAVDAAGLTANALNGNGASGVSLNGSTSFNAWMQAIMTQGSDVKLAFCGPNAYAAISKYANSAQGGYRIMQGESESIFGLNLTVIQTPFGRIDLASHPLFKNVSYYNGHMFVVDLELITQKTFEKLFFQEYEPTNGSDSRQGQFRGKLGLKLKFPAAFGYAYNLQQINA